jgi:hypothetical protein
MKDILDETLIGIDQKVEEIRKNVFKGNMEKAYLAAEALKIKADDALHLVLGLSDFD